VPGRRLGREERALEVDVGQRVPVRLGDLERVVLGADAGVVDQDVQPAELGGRRVASMSRTSMTSGRMVPAPPASAGDWSARLTPARTVAPAAASERARS
jgi:hypothetical protein